MAVQIILASASPRRKQLLKKIIKKFSVVESCINESAIKANSSAAYAKKAALAKAWAVAARYKKAIIIGADTIVVLGSKILGKPSSHKEAKKSLKLLSGKTHKVITGLAVIAPKQRPVIQIVVTKVHMKNIPDKEIAAYVKEKNPLDKAGGYGIQEIENIFIDRISGDYDNVVGLPVFCLKQILNKLI